MIFFGSLKARAMTTYLCIKCIHLYIFSTFCIKKYSKLWTWSSEIQKKTLNFGRLGRTKINAWWIKIPLKCKGNTFHENDKTRDCHPSSLWHWNEYQVYPERICITERNNQIVHLYAQIILLGIQKAYDVKLNISYRGPL